MNTDSKKTTLRAAWISWPLLAATLLLGCGSNKPAEYHLLPISAHAPTQVAESTATPPPSQTACTSLGVNQLTLPEYLNSNNIVGLLTESTVKVSDERLWYEPLDKAMKRALTLALIRELPQVRVQEFPWRQDDQPTCSVSVIFFELIQSDENEWVSKLQWQLHYPPQSTFFSDTNITVKLSETELSKDLPQAYAYIRVIDAVSQSIAKYMKALPRTQVEFESGEGAQKAKTGK